MLHTFRQVARYTALSIGFLLFFFVTIHAAQTANNRKAVEGKRLLPTTQVVTVGTEGMILVSGNSTISAASTVNSGKSAESSAAKADKSQSSAATAHADVEQANANAGKVDTIAKHKR